MSVRAVQWYSPTSAKWSGIHFYRHDWLCSDPPVTLCGRKPARQHRQIRVPVSQGVHAGDICNGCRREHESMGDRGLSVRPKAWYRKVTGHVRAFFSRRFRKRDQASPEGVVTSQYRTPEDQARIGTSHHGSNHYPHYTNRPMGSGPVDIHNPTGK